MVGQQMIAEAQLEVHIGAFVQRVTPAQFGGVDQGLAGAGEFAEAAGKLGRVERGLDLVEGGIVLLVEKRGITPEPIAQLVLDLLIEPEFVAIAAEVTFAIELVADITTEQFVGPLARQHYLLAIGADGAGKHQRAGIVTFLQRTFGVANRLA